MEEDQIRHTGIDSKDRVTTQELLKDAEGRLRDGVAETLEKMELLNRLLQERVDFEKSKRK